ncbi:MAG: hypothetical protein WBF51_04275 [Candidatus Dormiibacterota bacterium]
MPTLPPLREMFGDDLSNVEIARKLEELNTVWAGIREKSSRGEYPKPAVGKFAALAHRPADPRVAQMQEYQRVVDLEKSLAPDQIASVSSAIEAAKQAQADIQKDWSFSNPSPALLPYDLLPVVQMLVNHKTPLYNRIAQGPAEGIAHHYLQVTGYSNTGQGGNANLLAGLNSDSISTAFGPINLRRGSQIAYSTNSGAVTMIEHGLSDQVNWGIAKSMAGQVDARQLSHTGLLWSSMLAAEREHLYGRGNQSGFSGALAAPTGVSIAASAAGAGQTGNTADIATLYVYVTSTSGVGESVASTVASSTALSAATGDIVTVKATLPAGATGMNVYCGTSTGITNCYFAANYQNGSVGAVVNFTGGGTGGCPNSGAQPPSADTSATAYSYDGILTAAVANGGFVGSGQGTNGAWLTTNVGKEFQDAFATLYGASAGTTTTNRLADPDEIFLTASMRRSFSDLLQTATSTNYRLTAQVVDGSIIQGGLVTGIQNKTTGRDSVPLTVHPYMPAGCAVIQSFTLPVPDSNVSETVMFRQVQPFMSVDWPDIQFSYDISTYWFGSLVHYAPAWSGALTQVNQ